MKSAAFSEEWLAALLPDYPGVSLCVALSGGVDSVTLLAALAEQRRSPLQKAVRLKTPVRAGSLVRGRASRAESPSLRAIHVHHGLHANAGKWSRHCTKVAAKLGIPLEIIKVKVERPRGASLEAAARDARYAALGKALRPGEVLLTAHHQDDQLETVLLQLLRGAGIAGLAAMPAVAPFAGGQLARPLLTRSRAELEEWARAHDVTWVDDDSNANEQLDRNYLRRSVLPLVRARWPGAAGAVSRSARHAAEARRLLDAVALADVERAAVGKALSVQRLRALDSDRRRNALRFWIAREGFTVPDTSRLGEIAGPLFDARPDANPQVRWNDTLVERHLDVLTVRAASASAHADKERAVTEVTWNWREQPQLDLAQPPGLLEWVPDRHGPLDLGKLPPQVIVRKRQGGETLRPSVRGRTRTLKSLLRESGLPLAARESLPLIFSTDALLAVADRWIDASVQAGRASRERARLRFRPR